MGVKKMYSCFLVLLIISAVVNARPQTLEIDERDADPGFVRRQFMRLGNMASRVGSRMGGVTVGLTSKFEKLCAIIKKIIPIVGAVCTVGQFKFCALDTTPVPSFEPGNTDSGVYYDNENLPIAGPGVDLNVQD